MHDEQLRNEGELKYCLVARMSSVCRNSVRGNLEPVVCREAFRGDTDRARVLDTGNNTEI
jgi:hypothetical protein